MAWMRWAGADVWSRDEVKPQMWCGNFRPAVLITFFEFAVNVSFGFVELFCCSDHVDHHDSTTQQSPASLMSESRTIPPPLPSLLAGK
jgi:hypothetical protein